MLRKATIAILQKQCEEVMGWNWTNGHKSPHANIGGPIALALLQSHHQDPQPSVWITLSQYTLHLKKIYIDKNIIPFRADIEYLALFGQHFNDKSAAKLGRDFFARVRARTPNGQDEFKRIVDARTKTPELVGYEVSIGVRAARALGEIDYAEQLVDATLASETIKIDDNNNSYQVLSAGAFLYAITLLQNKKYNSVIAKLSKKLERLQRHNGAWAFNDTQATAYALLGLTGAKEYLKNNTSRQKAWAWLMQSQLKNGDWAIYHDGLPEPFVGQRNTLVQAETLQAILAGI